MKRGIGAVVVALPLAVALAAPAAARHDEDRVIVNEWTSTNAVDISVEFSVSAYPEIYEGIPVALVARDDGFADALASAALQGVAGAPLLLTQTRTLAPQVEQELRRLRPDRIVILGGTGAVSAEVEQRLKSVTPKVDRVAGADRITTATAIAAMATRERASFGFGPGTAIIVRAFGEGSAAYVDALGAGAMSVQMFGAPVLLTETDRLSPATEAFLREHDIAATVVIGGRAAVSDEALAQIRSVAPETVRVSGPDRFTTALAIARHLYGDEATQADADGVFLVDANDPLAWATGFTGALTAGGLPSPVMLVAGDIVPAATAEWLGGAPIPADDDLGFRYLLCGAGVQPATCHESANIVDDSFAASS